MPLHGEFTARQQREEDNREDDLAEYDSEDEQQEEKKPAKRKTSDEQRAKRTDHTKNEEAPEDAFSHYLHLADGSTRRFNVGDNPHGTMPTTFGEDNIRVIGVYPA
jgi:hypothetical protein